jgi:hypothetical protein
VKPVGEPDAGDRHVRFDERGWETARCRMAQATAPILDSTIAAQGHPAACPQLAKADFASSSQHVREGQRIAELEAEIEDLQRQALALGAEPTADFAPWVLLGVKIDQCPHSAEGDMRAPNEWSGFHP